MSTTLEWLGFSPSDRVIILHADDVGMCHAANVALQESWGSGVLTSCSVMVPCPWFPEAAAFARTTANMDMGVHITLTSEWEGYRWGPISTRDAASGLVDEQGYFWRSVQELVAHADPEAVAVEMRAQIDAALRAGIDVTHIDTHMFAAFSMPFVRSYLQLASEYRLPAFIPQLDPQEMDQLDLDQGTKHMAQQLFRQLDAMKIPKIDRFFTLWGDTIDSDPLAAYKRAFAELRPGITHVICHPAHYSAELTAIDRGNWSLRASDEELSKTSDLIAYLGDIGVQRIGYRHIRDLLRSSR